MTDAECNESFKPEETIKANANETASSQASMDTSTQPNGVEIDDECVVIEVPIKQETITSDTITPAAEQDVAEMEPEYYRKVRIFIKIMSCFKIESTAVDHLYKYKVGIFCVFRLKS